MKFILFILIFSFFTPAISKEIGQQALSPKTTLSSSDQKKTERMAPLLSLPDLADKKRSLINASLFQENDVQGVYPSQNLNQTPRLAQEEAFLIAEAIAHTYKEREKAMLLPPKQGGRVLITRDHLATSEVLARAAAAGALIQGLEVTYHAGPLPTGAAHFYGLKKNYDITIHVTGSDKIVWRNKMKISVRQNKEGKFDPNGKLKDLDSHQEKPLAEIIGNQANEIIRARNNAPMRHFQDTNNLEDEKIIEFYITNLKKRFGRLQMNRQLVVFANDAVSAALIPVLKNQGHIIKREKSASLSIACQRLKNETPPSMGLVIDEAGEAIHLIDEKGGIIPSSALATLVYQDFISKNKETLMKLENSVTLALDTNLVQIGDASALESLASLLNQDKTALNNANIGAVYITSNFLSTYRRHIAQEIEKLCELKLKILRENPNPFVLCGEITNIINSFVLIESSGHYFSVTNLDLVHDSSATNDGIFWAARLLEILDTRNIPMADKNQQEATYLTEISV